jgi:DNA-directed RNA polymerase subunit RPC12/RpoP
MIQVTYRCPDCDEPVRSVVDENQKDWSCPRCGRRQSIKPEAIAAGSVGRCLVCSGDDLFVRKDFPQRVGVSIVIFGFAASCVAWWYHRVVLTFAILFATALADVTLYLFMGDILECYRCHAQYRGGASLSRHGPFELEVHERYRQQKARMEQARASSDRTDVTSSHEP